ncbi:MerR family transcriptional regulator [Amycolatopsis sp. OK19-0408]|uniref:MerR family transcriptional regulator n=1 Tax=Amycolatopsis iheyensis TaxID=2945988 RepID=A0A9X2N6Q2_9PSEU|nr:MerR family transcriptional regulator [Amycolatopsis iheyensis]MCR6482984.1 MerR family transcriptional regulator [Amycolatopsis iheyensis]
MKSSELTIGQLGRRFGLATHVLRHWESVGLLAPARDAGGQRRYGEDDLFRIALILMSKEVGVGLRDVAEFLASGGDKTVLRRHLGVLERRIEEAQAAKELIEHALECPLKLEDCPHAPAEITARIPPP